MIRRAPLFLLLLACDSRPQDPPPETRLDLTPARAYVAAGRWAEAEDAYRSLNALDLVGLCADVRDVLRAAAEGDPYGAQTTLGTITTKADALTAVEERLAWRVAIARLWTEISMLVEEEKAFRKLMDAWPTGEAWPAAAISESVRDLLLRRESRIAKRTLAWLTPRVDEQFARAERLIEAGKVRQGLDGLIALLKALPVEPWVSRAQETYDQHTRTVGEKTPVPMKALFEIPLDFVPTDYIALADGERIVALYGAAEEVVVVSLKTRSVERSVRIVGRPRTLVEIGQRLWIGTDDGPIRLVDKATWTESGCVHVPTSGVTAIVSSVNGRVIAASSRHLVEIDPKSLRVTRMFEELREPRRQPARIAVRPDGALLYAFGGVDYWIWRLEDGSGEHTHRQVYASVSDAHGQFLLGPGGVYDSYLNSVQNLQEHESDILVHPQLPFAIYFNRQRQTLKALDLYQLQFGPTVDCTGSIASYPKYGGTLDHRARLSADARTVFVCGIQPPAGRENGKTTLTALPAPVTLGETLPGHLAFVSLPPAEAFPGWEFRYAPRLSAPATIRVLVAPEGATWSEGEVRWTPRIGDVGKREIRLRAEDSETGRVAEQRLSLDVRFRMVLRTDQSQETRLSPDGRYLVATDRRSNVVRIYDFEADLERSILLPFSSWSVVVTGGRLWAADSRLGRIVSWSLETWGDEKRIDVGDLPRLLVRGNTGSTLVVVGDPDGDQGLVLPGDVPKPVGRIGRGWSMAVSPDGDMLLGPGVRGLTLYRFRDGRFEPFTVTDLQPQGVEFSFDGRLFRTGTQIYEMESSKLVKTPTVLGVRFDPTGAYAGTYSHNQTVEIVDLRTMKATRLELPRAGFGYANPRDVTPLSKWKRIMVESDRGVLLVPFEP